MLIANGDSFTQEIHLNLEDRWTTKIGVSKNLAHGGGSHERVLKTTIEALNCYDVTSLIIGWPTPERTMMPLANGSIAILGATQSFDENTTENHQYLSNFYIKHCFNPYYHFKQRLEYMVFLQNYCFAKKIKIVYFLSTKEEINDKILWELSEEAFMSRSSKDIELSGIKNNFGILKKLISQIRDEIWVLRPWYSMSEHCAPYEHLECGHPAEEGSSSWADIIKKYL